MMKYKKLCENIIKYVGGKDNVSAVVHCVTRLRFTLKDRSKANIEELLKLDEVIDVVSNQVAFQVIIGPQVIDVHGELIQMLGMESKSAEKSNKGPFHAVLDLLSESMSPILEPIMAAGMLAGIMSILSLTGIVSADSQTYIIFDTLRGAVFFFLPVFMAMSCAKRLHASPYLAVTLAVTLLSTGINGVEGLRLFGIALKPITYSSSFFPIILAVWLMGHVEELIRKILPKSLVYFFKPVLTLLICLPVTLLVFGPIGTWIGDGINFVCTFFMNTFGNWSVVALYSALQPFLIMMGAANFVTPVLMNFYATLGYDPLFTFACVVSDIAVAGAVFGYFLRTKDIKKKQLFGTTAFSALLNVTEPAIYGVFVKYRRPFVAVMIGGGLGGLYAGVMGVKAYALTGLIGITSYIGNQDYANFYNALIAIGISLSVSTIASYLLGIPETDEEKGMKADTAEPENASSHTQQPLLAPVKGTVIALDEVGDRAFSSGALGKGVAFTPEEDTVCAPIDGEVVSLFPTLHAIGIRTSYGIEVLIHIGVNTVELNGMHFQALIKQGDTVKAGQPLVKADFDKIKEAGYDTTVIMIITNTSDYLDVIPNRLKRLNDMDPCLTVIV